MTEDLSVFFDTDGFAISATFTLSTGNVSTVDGIFDQAYADPMGAEDSQPSFICAAAEVAAVVHGTRVTINAVDYTVRGVDPDGTGVVRLILELADG